MENYNEKLRELLNKQVNYFYDNKKTISTVQYACRTYGPSIKSIQKIKNVKPDNIIETSTILSNIFFSILKKDVFELYSADTEKKNYFFENIDFNNKSNDNKQFYIFYDKLTKAEDMELSFLKKSSHIINRLYDKNHELIFLIKGKSYVKDHKLFYEIECEDTNLDLDYDSEYSINSIKHNLMKIPTSLVAIIIDKILIIIGDNGRIFFDLDKRDYTIALNNFNALRENNKIIDNYQLFWEYIEGENLIKDFSMVDTKTIKNLTLSTEQINYLKSKGVSIKNNQVQIRTNQDVCYFVGLLSKNIYYSEINNEDVFAKKRRPVK